SPEVILGISYGRPIDCWSLGCILAELYTGLPLFPGENEVEQLACIMEIMNVPPKHVIEMSSRRKQFFDSSDNPRLQVNSRGKKRRPGMKDLASALRCNDAQFISFLEGFLRWDPRERFTADDGLRHEWIMDAMIPPKPAHETWGDVSSAKETQNHATTGGGGSAGGKYECAPAAKDGASGASGIGGHLGSLAEGFQQGKEGKEVDSTGAVQASHRQAIAQQGNSSANGPYQPTGGGNGTAAAQGENGPSLSSNTAPEHVNNQQTPAQAAQVHTPAHSAQHQQHQQQQPQQAQHGGAQAQTQAFGTIPRQLISSLPLGLSVLSQKPNTLLPPIDGIPTSLVHIHKAKTARTNVEVKKAMTEEMQNFMSKYNAA
ncbi:Dual specificity tyrosine-phosphorylation-regulated kinase 2, partial [Diplonema papillatum]